MTSLKQVWERSATPERSRRDQAMPIERTPLFSMACIALKQILRWWPLGLLLRDLAQRRLRDLATQQATRPGAASRHALVPGSLFRGASRYMMSNAISAAAV